MPYVHGCVPAVRHPTSRLLASTYVQICELWERYVQAFDVVVADDGDMEYVNQLVDDIIDGGGADSEA